MTHRRVTHAIAWLQEFQIRRAGWLTFLLAISVVAAALVANRLQLRTEFTALLPDQSPSVIEYRRLTRLLPGSSKVLVVVEGHDRNRLRTFGDRLVGVLEPGRFPWVVSAEDGVQLARRFLLPRLLLFADQGKLEQWAAIIREKGDRELIKAADLDLGLDDDAALDEEPAVVHELRELRSRWDRYPDGYYESKDGRALVVVVHTNLQPGEIERSRRALDQLRAAVAIEASGGEFTGIRVDYAGDMTTGLTEYGRVRNDLLRVGGLGLVFVLGAIYLYFLRMRALLALGVTIVAGCAWTFASTQLTIGHLNIATGFLFSIVAGNGINFGIIFLGRYFEELGGGNGNEASIRVAIRTTWKATLTAALAAAAAYASLWVSEFRGLKHFAVIGALGMLLCWLATYLLLPAVLVLLDRVVPSRCVNPSRGLRYEAPFLWLVEKAPGVVVIACVAVTTFCAIAIIRNGHHDPMQYDMKRLFNQAGAANEQKRLSTLARDIIGVANESSMAILCDRQQDTLELTRALQRRWDAAPSAAKPSETVHAITDFVPRDQAQKIAMIDRIRTQLAQARSKGLLSESLWRELEPVIPTETLKPFGLYDLPASVARPFTERDGQRGRIVYIEPTHGADEDDVRYLMQWANSFRVTPLDSGRTVLGSGRIVIFADMISAVLKDLPRASLLSFVLTAIIVLLTIRHRRDVALVLGGLALGVLWLAGLFLTLGLKLNFLNFMALPITFGIGVDYAVNFVQRHRQNDGALPTHALAACGGAVILCSLTTSLGYIALLESSNQAVHSLGLLAVLGEISCLLAAVLVLPSFLQIVRAKRAAATLNSRRKLPQIPGAASTDTVDSLQN